MTAKTSVISSPKMNAGRFRLLFFLVLVSIVTYLDRVNISIAAAPISQEFGFDRVKLGTIFSAFLIGYMLFQIPGGWLGDRFGHGRIIVFALLWWSIFTALTGLAGSTLLVSTVGVLPGFWLIRFLIGVGEAAAYPCANGLVATRLDPRQRALAAGVMLAGVGAGSAFAPPLIASLMLHFGWRSSFYVCGGIGVVSAIIFHFYLARGPRATEKSEPKILQPTPWKQILSHPQLWLLTISDFLHGYIVYFYFYWFYLYLVDVRGFSLLRGSWFATLPFFAMMVLAPLGGWSSDRLVARIGRVRARRRVAMSGLVAGAVLIFLGATLHNAYAAIACLALAAGSIYFALGCYWVTALEIFPPYSATVSGVMNAGANLGGAISPILSAWVAVHYGWMATLCIAAGFSLAAAVLWKFIGIVEDSTEISSLTPVSFAGQPSQ
jgi:ACS family glucarate transporter-like MFS transporter